jgi:hypothetical protein
MKKVTLIFAIVLLACSLIFLFFKENTSLVIPNECEKNSNPVFVHHITDINKVEMVVPPPSLIAGHLKTHSYIDTRLERVPVYAPVDSTFSAGTYYFEENSQRGEYMLDFSVSCDIRYRFDHITEPVESIQDALQDQPAKTSRTISVDRPIVFKAGDLIGYTTGGKYGNWDFGVYDSSKPNYFADDPDWNTSETYTTGQCSFNYFTPELAQDYIDLFGQWENDEYEEFCAY